MNFDVEKYATVWLQNRSRVNAAWKNICQLCTNSLFLFLGISGSFRLRRSAWPGIHGSELVLANCDDCDTCVTRLDGPESVWCWFLMVNDDGPVRSPSPSSSSSATLLLLLIFATDTLVQACGKRAVLIMWTPMSSGSLASLFEGDGDDISSKSISVTNLQKGTKRKKSVQSKANWWQFVVPNVIDSHLSFFFHARKIDFICLWKRKKNLKEKMVENLVVFAQSITYE